MQWLGNVDAKLISPEVERESDKEKGKLYEIDCPSCKAVLTIFVTDKNLSIIKSVYE